MTTQQHPVSPLRSALRTIGERTVPRRDDFPVARGEWLADLVAGVTVGVVALPLALGFGVGAGMGAAAGLVTAIVAGIVAALFGGSRLQVSGPTGAMTVVLLPVIADHGAGAVPVLAIMAGVLVVAGGWLGLGRAVTLIPWPVVEGFTLGIAAIIFLQQLPLVLDVQRAHHDAISATWHALSEADWPAALPGIGIALGVVAIMAAARYVAPRLPGSLVALVVVTVAATLLELDVALIGTVGIGSLAPSVGGVGVGELGELLGAAAIIALLAALESLLSVRVADGMADTAPTDPDRELVGQGLANIACGVFGGMPATGAIARTAVNVRAGARTRVASATHGVVLLLVLLGASRLVAQVPLAALAGVLMVTAVRMVDPGTVRALLVSSRADALVFVATAATTIVFDLVLAVEIGIAIAAVLALRASARASSVYEEDPGAHANHVEDSEVRALLREHVVVYRLQGALFFGAAQHFLEELTALDKARVVVLRLGALHTLDASGAHALAETIEEFDRRGIEVLVCGARPQHRRVLDAVGIPGERIAGERMFDDLGAALARARELAATAR